MQQAADLAPLVGWPLLPLRGGGLSALLPAMRSTVLQPAPEWPPHLLDALEALCCRQATSPSSMRIDSAQVLGKRLSIFAQVSRGAEALREIPCKFAAHMYSGRLILRESAPG